ncbi:MAG: hypothetical protein HY397_03670 [Candidatus Doudnabacteria bacterium]|nr:hypothetical protein [Candidatus Doudnabacteria bacterium]
MYPIVGILESDKDAGVYVRDELGQKHLLDCKIWSGYLKHWIGKAVQARILREKDYESGKPLALLWPQKKPREESGKNFLELYFLERLAKYWGSLFGHSAINLNGRVFNFAHKLNENEEMSEEEFFYRPALGEFAPNLHGKYDTSDPEKPHYDKFGRVFMRTIHAFRIEGWETSALIAYYREMLAQIKNRGDIRKDEYRDFNPITQNCVTIIRDGLRSTVLKQVKGILPKDFFASCVLEFLKLKKQRPITISFSTIPQILVPEAPKSRSVPLLNPVNFLRRLSLKKLTLTNL